MAEDWLDPGMFMGDGVRDLCLTTWLMFLTVSKTRFWWLGRMHNIIHEEASVRITLELNPPKTINREAKKVAGPGERPSNLPSCAFHVSLRVWVEFERLITE